MTINNLELRNFGKFQDRSVNLQDGLNVLYAPNETGKSTLAGFIRYMLYGFPKNERSSATNPLTTAQRFKPWTGGEPGGSLTLTVDGRRVTVVREGAKSVRVYDTVTATDIPLKREIGEELYGLSLETFESTAFFGQSALHHVSMDELEDKLKNMVTGADEKVSYDKAREALHKAKNKIDSGRAGVLPDLRRDLTELSYRIEQVRQEQAELSALTQGCEGLTRQLAAAQTERKNLEEKMAASEGRIEEEFARQRQHKEEELASTRSHMQQVQTRLGGLDRRRVDQLSQVSQRLRALREVLGDTASPRKTKRPIALLIVGLVMAAAGAGLLALLPLPWPLIVMAIGGLCLIEYGIVCYRSRIVRQQNRTAYAREQERQAEAARLQEVLIKYLGEQDDYETSIRALYDDLTALTEYQAQCQQCQDGLSAMDIEAYRHADQEYHALVYQKEQTLRLEQQLQLALAEKKTQWEERQRHIGSVDVLESSLHEKQQRVTAAEAELAAYQLALQSLDAAHLEMTHLYAPMLTDRTAHFFATVTGDTARRVSVDVTGTVKVEEKQVARKLPFYSTGTSDAVYIALRLALIDMLYAKEKPTLVFDDSFANFDEGRTREVLTLLGKLAQQTQILYFTCRDPEPFLQGIEHHNIVL